MTRKFVAALILIVWSLGGGLSKAEEKASRPAVRQDIVGTWDLASVRPVHDPKDPTFYPYQRYVFKEDSSMKFMVSDKPFSKDWLDKFEKQPSEIDYRLDEKGILTLTWQTQPHSESAICAFVLKDVPPEIAKKIPAAQRSVLPKQGDLTLSFLNRSGRIAYQKVLTKKS